MYELIKNNQLDIMLVLCGACGILGLLLIITRFLSKSRKRILLLMMFQALFLLWFDRQAYIYAGDPGYTGYIMVRISNFMVFFLTSAMVFGMNLYIRDWMRTEGGMKILPKRLDIVQVLSICGMLLAVISAFTGLYYYFDESNKYHRGSGFIIAYVIPVFCPMLQLSVVLQFKKVFRKLIFISLLLYLIVPVLCGIIQIKAYGISIVNMAMVAVSISLYFFTYLDINDVVIHAHKTEMRGLEEERKSMKRLFDQTARAFVSAIDAKDEHGKGHSARVAEYARKIAHACGKSDRECDEIYYSALLHDVGKIGISDEIIAKDEELTKEEFEILKTKSLIGDEILSSIEEYPYLRKAARSVNERYDGSGYPDGLKGDEIPEVARIVAVADEYDKMSSSKSYRDPFPQYVVREDILKGAGIQFDPRFASIMVNLIDFDPDYLMQEKDSNINDEPVREIEFTEYKKEISPGVLIERNITKLSFKCEKKEGAGFSAPSLIIFDSYDKRIHDEAKTIKAFHYIEYGEIWFDGNTICTAASKISAEIKEDAGSAKNGSADENFYEITAGHYEDHINMHIKNGSRLMDVVIALPDSSRYAYMAITGENCRVYDIDVEKTDILMEESDIKRIAPRQDYTDRLEGDIPNIQILGTRAVSTEGFLLKDFLRLTFRTMTLPSSDFVWNCPYIILFTSRDGKVGGDGYKEYSLVKLNGESNDGGDFADNKIEVSKDNGFRNWDKWMEDNQKGLECEAVITRKGRTIIINVEDSGVSIKNTTVIKDDLQGELYIALTGDLCVLTDIRIRNH